MDKEDRKRLTDICYAARGERCRTRTFINPNLGDAPHYEWMEAECQNGRDWAIKIMKATLPVVAPEEPANRQVFMPYDQGWSKHGVTAFGPLLSDICEYEKNNKGGSLRFEVYSANGKDWFLNVAHDVHPYAAKADSIVSRHYLTKARSGVTFGAAILKLAEYETAQQALGFLIDSDDYAEQAGAPHFTKIAERGGIVFNVAGEPVAPLNGLLTASGQYPISAFKAAYDFAQSGAMESSSPVDIANQVQGTPMKMIAAALEEISDNMHDGTSLALKYNAMQHLRYHDFSSRFERVIAYAEDLAAQNALPPSVNENLQHFKFHTYRLCGAWMMETMKREGGFSDGRSFLAQAIARCTDAAKIIMPGVALNMDEVMNFARAKSPDWDIADRTSLKAIIEIFKNDAAVLPAQGARLESAHVSYFTKMALIASRKERAGSGNGGRLQFLFNLASSVELPLMNLIQGRSMRSINVEIKSYQDETDRLAAVKALPYRRD